jgi:hypothetical protein
MDVMYGLRLVLVHPHSSQEGSRPWYVWCAVQCKKEFEFGAVFNMYCGTSMLIRPHPSSIQQVKIHGTAAIKNCPVRRTCFHRENTEELLMQEEESSREWRDFIFEYLWAVFDDIKAIIRHCAT